MPGFRALISLLLVLAFSVTGSACGEKDRVPEPDDENSTENLLFAIGDDASSGDQIYQAVNRWNDENEGRRVVVVPLAGNADEQRTQLVATAQGGNPCYDVVGIDVPWTAEFARAEFIVELDPATFELEGEFLDAPRESGRWRNRQYAIPFFTDAGLLYYRSDLLAKYDLQVPTSLTELVAAARVITARERDIGGYAGQFDRYEGLTVNALEIIRAFGGDLAAGDEAVTNPGRVRDALALLADGTVSGGWIGPRAVQYREETSRAAFQHGEFAFLRNWPYVYTFVTGPDSDVADSVKVAPLPWPSVSGGINLAVSSCSRRQQSARDFIRFMTNVENQRILFEKGGYAAVREGVYNDPTVLAANPYARQLLESVRMARPRSSTPYYYRSVSEVIQSVVADVISKTLTPDAAVQELDRKLTTALLGE